MIFREGYFDINRTSKREEGFDINGGRLIITDNLGLKNNAYSMAFLITSIYISSHQYLLHKK